MLGWRRRSYFLLVKVRPGGERTLTLPLPLCVAEELLSGLAILAWLAGPLWRKRLRRWAGHRGFWGGALSEMSPYRLLGLLREMVRELRAAGPFTLLEVREGDTLVSVRTV